MITRNTAVIYATMTMFFVLDMTVVQQFVMYVILYIIDIQSHVFVLEAGDIMAQVVNKLDKL